MVLDLTKMDMHMDFKIISEVGDSFFVCSKRNYITNCFFF